MTYRDTHGFVPVAAAPEPPPYPVPHAFAEGYTTPAGYTVPGHATAEASLVAACEVLGRALKHRNDMEAQLALIMKQVAPIQESLAEAEAVVEQARAWSKQAAMATAGVEVEWKR